MCKFDEKELVQDLFGPISREGAASIEVAIKLQRSLKSLAELDPKRYAAATRSLAEIALSQNLKEIATDFDRERIRRVAYNSDAMT